MRIDDTSLSFDSAWEGELKPATGAFGPTRGETSALVISIGKPSWWGQQNIMGDQLVTPAGGKRYGLARFAFSLRPKERQERQEVKRVEFIAYLHAKGAGERPIAFDLLPKTTTIEGTGKVTVGIDPKFKFASAVEVSGFKAETEIDLKQAVPVIVADGVGESTARWVFESRPTHPLLGSQSAYVIVELPPGVDAARASLLLSAEVGTRLGPARYLLPKEQREQLSFVLA